MGLFVLKQNYLYENAKEDDFIKNFDPEKFANEWNEEERIKNSNKGSNFYYGKNTRGIIKYDDIRNDQPYRRELSGRGVDDHKLNNETIEKNKNNIVKILDQANYKPKSWISQKIAWLRSLYKKILFELHKPSKYTGGHYGTFKGLQEGIKDSLKRLARFILTAIDKLLYKLQNYFDK